MLQTIGSIFSLTFVLGSVFLSRNFVLKIPQYFFEYSKQRHQTSWGFDPLNGAVPIPKMRVEQITKSASERLKVLGVAP